MTLKPQPKNFNIITLKYITYFVFKTYFIIFNVHYGLFYNKFKFSLGNNSKKLKRYNIMKITNYCN